MLRASQQGSTGTERPLFCRLDLAMRTECSDDGVVLPWISGARRAGGACGLHWHVSADGGALGRGSRCRRPYLLIIFLL